MLNVLSNNMHVCYAAVLIIQLNKLNDFGIIKVKLFISKSMFLALSSGQNECRIKKKVAYSLYEQDLNFPNDLNGICCFSLIVLLYNQIWTVTKNKKTKRLCSLKNSSFFYNRPLFFS